MNNQRTLKLILEYDGSRFAGWQVQPETRTVQAEVENALAVILRQPIRVVAAGRTDAGVHAAGQVVSFRTTSTIECTRLVRALNGVLPKDVAVITASDMSEGFNARFTATARTYRYTITNHRIAVGRAYAWHVKHALSRDLLVAATEALSGACDLRGFSKGDDADDYSTIILKKSWTFSENLSIFEIQAIRFFHHAVRSIVGTAVEVARGREPVDLVRRILDTRERSLAGPTAPSQGLCLVAVDYGDIQARPTPDTTCRKSSRTPGDTTDGYA